MTRHDVAVLSAALLVWGAWLAYWLRCLRDAVRAHRAARQRESGAAGGAAWTPQT